MSAVREYYRRQSRENIALLGLVVASMCALGLLAVVPIIQQGPVWEVPQEIVPIVKWFPRIVFAVATLAFLLFGSAILSHGALRVRWPRYLPAWSLIVVALSLGPLFSLGEPHQWPVTRERLSFWSPVVAILFVLPGAWHFIAGWRALRRRERLVVRLQVPQVLPAPLAARSAWEALLARADQAVPIVSGWHGRATLTSSAPKVPSTPASDVEKRPQKLVEGEALIDPYRHFLLRTSELSPFRSKAADEVSEESVVSRALALYRLYCEHANQLGELAFVSGYSQTRFVEWSASPDGPEGVSVPGPEFRHVLVHGSEMDSMIGKVSYLRLPDEEIFRRAMALYSLYFNEAASSSVRLAAVDKDGELRFLEFLP